MGNPSNEAGCAFCRDAGGEVLFNDALCRVVLVGGDEGAAFPGFCRVICNRHVREMSDLDTAEQRHLYDIVMAAERAVRAVQQPHKLNLASLGNVTPHVHWHVIPRWQDDSHFPGPIWGAALRAGTVRPGADGGALQRSLDVEIRRSIA